jgi:cell division protein FtsB
LIIAGVVLLAYLIMDFNNRVTALQQLTAQRDVVAAEVASLKATESALRTAIAYATSDAAVVDWAYQDGGMVRPGDYPVVPVAPAGVTPAPTAAPQVVRREASNWQLWWLLFFDPPRN